ncbi:MAG TPA: acylneuraminate cytidylyltransferase family protein [Lachnospiraceae bacterium]|jgi:CMP-N,N'-diacetyllegionaminic acid synthase|nr:acylneuraminate cytidylyltransferase family protein [Lachnospiraceae bacterium]
MTEVLAIIPARSGSKSVKDKNIRLIDGKPMLAYSIEHAAKSRYITRTIVSTDSERYAEIAKEYGAEVPFLRPAEYATDTALDYDVFAHALRFLKETEGYEPELVVQLRPTYPIRNPEDIDCMIEQMLADRFIDSMRCMAPATEIPYKMWFCESAGENEVIADSAAFEITPIMTDIPECYNMPRQQLPKVYYQNACIDVIRTNVITIQQSMSGRKIYGYKMKENFDIDTEEEFERAEEYLRIQNGNKRFVFDIDGVIAGFRAGLDYDSAPPNEEMIRIINRLYDMGNEIILFTARGYVTGIDWYAVTEKQMKEWGLKYHELHFGKPNADYYVDDKMLDMKFLLQYFG